jgi:hypothetical protein
MTDVADDPSLRASMARTAYADALAHRDATRPGDPGYHDAVLTVGLAWSQLRYWERRAAAPPGTSDTAPGPSRRRS